MGQCSSSPVEDDGVFRVPGYQVQVRSSARMGWKPDLPDFRDRVVSMPARAKKGLPKAVDLRPKEHFDLYDQGHLGSCTANAIGAAFHFDQVRQGLVEFTPARLFIYYNERAMEGSIGSDAGAYIRDGVKSLKNIGCCSEKLWPYDEGAFRQKPSEECYAEAAGNRCMEYARVPQTVEDMKAVLSSGYPFVFGFIVLSSFMTAEVAATGDMPMPQDDDQVLGGHAVCCVGYDDARSAFIVRNSWGSSWGDGGYFYMPYDYIRYPQLAQDFWYMQTVEGKRLPSKPAMGKPVAASPRSLGSPVAWLSSLSTN